MGTYYTNNGSSKTIFIVLFGNSLGTLIAIFRIVFEPYVFYVFRIFLGDLFCCCRRKIKKVPN